MRKMILSVIGVIALAVCGFASSATYCVIDLSGGAAATSYPVTYLDSVPAGGWSDEYKTTKLVLKRCEPGSFLMDEAQKPSCRVTLTQPFYLGVFEVTQKQWVQVMGSTPPYSGSVADNHPAHWIAYNAVRGSSLGTQWPFSREVDETSFLGRLRAKTGIDDFDLPTEAQWEYACRAGTTTKFSYGDTANREYMWYDADENVSHEVGTRPANPWGFYDMHGNVWEWCRDWYGTLMYGTDPCGAVGGTDRIKRGGSHYNDESYCHSSFRHHDDPSYITQTWGGNFGFRLSCGGDDPAIWTGPEARVGATEYDTLQAAADAASDGAVIEVLREIRLAAPLKLGAKSLTFDGHGSRILAQQDTGAVSVTAGASRVSLSFRDISVANFSSGANSGAFHCSGPCDLVLSNCSLTAYNAIYAASSANAAVSVGGDDTFFNASSALVKSASGATITLSLAGGTYTKTPGTNVAPGYGFVDNGDSTWTVFKYPDDASAYTGQTTVGSYTISIPEQLDVLGEKTRAGQTYAGSTFTLTSDIDFCGVARRPIGTFNGVFDGAGHTISNLVINLPTTDDVGLFSILKNATIKNLSVRGGRIEARCRAGGLAGRFSGGVVVEDCTTDLEVVAQGYDAGGIVAWMEGSSANRLTRCRALGPVTAYAVEDRAGGLVAVNDGSFTIDSCYASGAVTGYGTTGHVGGLLGRRYGGTVTVTNSYSVSRLQGNYLTQGGSTDDDIVGTGTFGVTVQSRPTVIDCFPKNKVNLAKRGNGSGTVSWNGNEPVATPDPGSVFIRWDNAIPEGEFNEITLYAVFGKAVATEQDLHALPAKGFFKQTADITMSDAVFNGLHNSPRFQGEYDGAGFAVKNLKVTSAGDNTGLFRTTQGAILKDIHLVGGLVTGGKHVGALIGAQNAGLTERCSASTVVRATGVHAAGLIGRADTYVTIRECWASGPVESTANYVGGLVSYISGNTSRIENCYARGDVKGDDIVGGFIGGADHSFVISNCYSSGKVDCGITAGGFFARNDGGKSVTGCFWDSTKAGQTRSTYGTGLATDAMFGSSAYDAWNADVWEFHANGYPTLKAMPNVPPTPLAAGCGKGTVSAVNNGNGIWTFTATPDEGSYFVRWGGLTTADATAPSVTIACDGSEAPAAVFGTCIRTVAELEAAWANPDTLGCYRLDADLDFAGTGVRMTQVFEGLFDGNGHTISNLVINLPTTDDVGLFSILRNATIKNLSIRGGRIEGRNRVGGIAGRVNGGTLFEDCTTDLEVVAQGTNAGGLVGYLDGTGNNRFTRCRTLGPVTSYAESDRAGGLVAVTDSSFTIDSCYASGAITGYGTTEYVGGLLGWRFGGTVTVTNSYSVSRLQGNYLTQGGSTDDDIVGSGTSGVIVQSRPTVIDCFPKNIVNLATRGNGSGTVSWNGNEPVATPDPGSVFIRWDNAIPEGEFNEITLYAVFGKAVASEADLRALPAKGFFKQTADIAMTTNITFEGLHNSPRFQGEYDGQGFEIRDLTIPGNNDYVALFRQTQGAVLRNVILKGGKVTGRTGVAPLVGWQYGGLVERCSADVEVVGTGDHAAGLVGRSSAYATIRESRALGSVKSNRYVGGLVSFTSGTAYTYDCYTLSDVTANSYAGGFISGADDTPVIHNCFAAWQVTSGTPVGGFYGRNDGGRTQITNNYWDKDASGQTASVYGTGLTTAEMQSMSNFASWNDEVWLKTEGAYPTLKAFAEDDTAERFTVTWENADGTTLAVQEEVRAGRVPQYQGTLPVKPVEGAKPSYFAGWSPKPTALTSNVTYRATFRESTARTWMTVDLATGRIGYADYDVPTATALFNTLEFKTTKMAFRRVAAGSDYYVQNGAYTAQMTNSYYIGVFEVTVAQFAMMQNGTKPASYVLADLKAQGSRNRNNTRGGAAAPAAFGAGITAGSPLGLFNARVRTANGDERLTFDLPTEAMWEVAARAAASGDLVRRTWNWYFGEDESLLADHAFIANDTSPDDWGNTSGIRVPGSRLPNDWGLFDMYGNARELCLDGATGETTPDYVQGNWTEAPGYRNNNQRTRGGGYDDEASRGRSSWRTYHDSGTYGHTGIRLARICSSDEEIAPEDVVVVPASITGGRNLRIPYSWFESFPLFATEFDDDYAAAALMPTGKSAADGTSLAVWQDFVLGTDPTNPEDAFRVLIEMVDGVPCVSWEPNLNTNGTVRIYRIFGKADLADLDEEWARVRPGHRFFKVTVEMPDGTAVSDEPGPVDIGGDWEPNLLCHLSFDDAGNDGLNVLKVRGGEDAIVRTNPTVVVSGLGAVTVVTDSSILTGLEPGDGAVYIPKKTHLALPIPGELLDREGHPYTIKMKVRFPGFGPWYSLLNMPASNNSDNLVYLHNSSTPYIQLKLTNKGSGKGFDGSGGFTANQWEELTFQFGESVTKVFLNGTEIFLKDVALSTTYADCSDAGGYFLLSADDDGDDTAMYWADVKVYDGIVDP